MERRDLMKLLATLPVGAFALSHEEVATVADLVVARGLAEQGRLVTVATRAARSSLVPGVDPETGARVVWEHVPAGR